jgi:16S rRNA (uracil1498-N3)-methyltransferase
MHRFFLPSDSIDGSVVRFPDSTSRQLSRVLRVQIGEKVAVLDNTGWEYEVTLTNFLDNQSALGHVEESRLCPGEPNLRITLNQCVLKGSNFDLVLQKCTEVGVSSFVPVYSERTIPNMGTNSAQSRRECRWRRILTEAAEQSGRGLIPTLNQGIDFRTACKKVSDTAIIPWEEERSTGLQGVLREIKSVEDPLSRMEIFIGPEGGFSTFEVDYARSLGIIPVSLGARILRAETAAIASVSGVMYELGLLGG